MSFRSTLLLSLVLAFTLNSCKEECEPIDVDSLNAIYLQFDTSGGADSFDPSELDSVYMVRYQIAEFDSFNFPVDTLNFYQDGFYRDDYRIRLSREIPSSLGGGPPYYSDFMYRFLGRSQDFQVRLQGIRLDGGYVDDCTYDARLKQFTLNDDTLVVTGSKAYVPMFKD